jgi:hypothetical protein
MKSAVITSLAGESPFIDGCWRPAAAEPFEAVSPARGQKTACHRSGGPDQVTAPPDPMAEARTGRSEAR